VDPVRNRFDELVEEGGRGVAVGSGFQAGEGDLGGTVNRHKKIESAFGGTDLGDVKVKVADRVALELLAWWFVAADFGEPADAVALEARCSVERVKWGIEACSA
jgi:hypothetical protein